MKIFQQCLRNSCDQLRFRFEQQQSLFQRAYLQYTQCAEQQFHSLGLFVGDKTSGSQDNDDGNIIGGGVIIGDSKPDSLSQYSLSQNYKKIVNVYESCYKMYGKNLDELDTFKDCQLNCLDRAVDITENKYSQSTLSTNLILAIVFSAVGFAIILFLLYKWEQRMRKQRDAKLQMELDGNYDQEDEEIGYEKSEKEYSQKTLCKPKPNYKSAYGPKISGGLSRLNVNKMKEIVHQMKQEHPEEEGQEEMYSFKKQSALPSPHKYHFQNEDIEGNTNYNSTNNSHFIQRKQIPRNSKRRQTDTKTRQSEQSQQQNTTALTNQNLLSFGSGHFNFTSNASITSSYKGSSRAVTIEQTNTLNQYHNSPQMAAVENKYINNILTGQEVQKNLTEMGYSASKECDQNDNTQQFACYQNQILSYTSPCEAQEKQARIISPKSSVLKSFVLQNQGLSPSHKLKVNNSADSNEISISPQIKNTLETQDFATASPELLKGKKNSLREQFVLSEKSTPPKSLQEVYESCTQINEDESEDGDKTIKVEDQVIYSSSAKTSAKHDSNKGKTKSLFEMQIEETQFTQQNGTVA